MPVNPFEPPKVPKPLSSDTAAKRSIGIVVILVLTPIAVGIAFAGSCAATMAFLNNSDLDDYGLVFVIGWLIFLIPPVAVLAGMVWWAVHAFKKPRT